MKNNYDNFYLISNLKGSTREWADATPITFKIEYYII